MASYSLLILLAAILCAFLQMNPTMAEGETDEAGKPAAEATTKSTEATTKSTEATTKSTEATTKSTETTTEAATTTAAKTVMETLIAELSTACKAQAVYCFGKQTDYKTIASQIPTTKAAACTLIKDKAESKTCLTTKEGSNVCTTDEFTTIQDAACFCPRIAASLIMVIGMLLVSKLF